MTHIDTQETLAANRRYFKGAMECRFLNKSVNLS